jgi:predicted  nucleic acid-binding Zn-ribbon protein
MTLLKLKCNSQRKLVLIHSGNNDQDLNHLKQQISAARKKLQAAWDEFDKLMNEYLRLTKK